MSKTRIYRGTGLMLWLGAGLTCLAQPSVVPAYLEGETAQADIITPVALEVVDLEKTELMRQEAAAKVPMIYRFEAEPGRTAEAEFRAWFSRHRERFMQAMAQAAQRPKLDQATVQHPSFFRFMTWFREQNPGFVLTTNLARHWALHEPDEPIQERWLGHLREAMNHCILAEAAVMSRPAGSALVRVVSAASPGVALTQKIVEKDGVTLRGSDLLSLAEAKAGLAAHLGQDAESLAPFLGGFVRENCFPEDGLTQARRRQAVADLLAMERYEAGQVIVRQGERIDGKAKLALDLLRTDPGRAGGSEPPGAGGSGGFWAVLNRAWQRTLSQPMALENTALRSLGLLAVISLAATVVLGWLVRRPRTRRPMPPAPAAPDESYAVVLNTQQNETVFLPVRTSTEASGSKPGASASEGHGDSGSAISLSDRFWQQRASEAERRAEEILAMVRAGLAPQLARQMMHKLVQELIFQRAEWLRTQRIAEQDLAVIEQRFTQAHGQLVDRLRAFEKRTEELEKALVVKAEENTELIKAHIALTQKQLETKQTAPETIWN